MRKATMTMMACATLLYAGTALWAAPASALTKCTATLRLTDGAILIEAKSVTGTLLWGNSAGTETNAFNNAATCVTGSPLVAKKCQLGATGSALAITPPPLCTVYLKDGAGTCAARIAKCTPGTRPLVELPSRFVDNGDGTLTDTQTGLMWEKKTGTPGGYKECGSSGSAEFCPDPEDVNNAYGWSVSGAAADGVAFTGFLPQVNGTLCVVSTCTGLGGHSDWRLPTIAELKTILLAPYPCGTSPCIDPSFGPTQSDYYWSATTTNFPSGAWYVVFDDGFVSSDFKNVPHYVRAVRGGL